MQPGPSSRGSVVPPLLILAFGVWVLVVSTGIRPGMLALDPGPAFLPRISGIALIGLSLILFFQRAPHEGMPRGAGLFRVAATVVLTGAYLLSLERIGFPAATALFLAVQMWVVGLRKPLHLTVLPIVLSYGIYVVFRYGLDVALPATRIWGVLI